MDCLWNMMAPIPWQNFHHRNYANLLLLSWMLRRAVSRSRWQERCAACGRLCLSPHIRDGIAGLLIQVFSLPSQADGNPRDDALEWSLGSFINQRGSPPFPVGAGIEDFHPVTPCSVSCCFILPSPSSLPQPQCKSPRFLT